MLVLTGLVAAASVLAAGPDGFEAITRPSEDVTLSFVRAGRVTTVPIKEGQDVQAGQVLVEQDDSAERLQLSQLQAQAESTVRVRAAQASLEMKKLAMQKTQEASTAGGATKLEVENAKLELRQAELSLEMVELERQQDARKCQELLAQLERMKIRSPIAGKVESISVKQGESVEALKKVIRVVNTSRMMMDVPVPVEQAARIAEGAAARIVFADPAGASLEGKVVFVAAVADAASGTRMVRVEFDNKQDRPAGERVKVSFQPASRPGSTKSLSE